MTTKETIIYMPDEYHNEKASNSYLMAVIAIMAGMPFPIINLVATFIFFMGNRKSNLFVKWHCTQALFSQIFIVIMNSVAFSWTMTIFFGNNEVSNLYLGYLITIFLFNAFEFVVTIHAAIVTRKGKHVEWLIFGPLTNIIIRPIRSSLDKNE